VRKTAICIATGLQAVLACCAAQAQSTVTVYGVVDAFVEYGTAGTSAARTHVTRLQSGGANGSRLGFRGTEDLGGGLKAVFVLEHGMLVDSGSPASATNFWNRQRYVGLSVGWGSLSAGRQYSPLLVHQDTFDTALSTTGYGSPYNSGVMRTVSRVNNSIVYSSPNVSGFSAAAMLGLGEVAGARGNTQSASVKYAGGPFTAGLAYAHVNKVDATKVDKSIWNLAGSYKLGDLLVSAAVQQTRNDSQNVGVTDDRREAFLGAVYAIGTGEIRAAYGQGKVVDVSNSTARHLSLGYLYNLSKRTALFAGVQAIRNPDNLAYRGTSGFTFDAIEGGLPAGAGVTARAFAVGARHRF
jgi:predicted porin